MNPAISASILAADVACLGDEVDHVLLAGAGRVHLDVMDHHYVPNLTFGPLVCEGLRRHGIEAPIVSINRERVKNIDDVRKVVSKHSAGVLLQIKRGDSALFLAIR